MAWAMATINTVADPACGNIHKTLKENSLGFGDFAEFIGCYKAEDRNKCRESKNLNR